MSQAMHILGAGLWTPGFADVAAWRRGPSDPSVTRPVAALLPTALRRRTSDLTRALADVIAEAAGDADLSAVHTVFGSAYGETGASIALLGMMHDGDGSLSPIRFTGSVHNAASGNISIATQNPGLTTSMAAGDDTVALALLEAWSVLGDRGGEVLVAVGDMPPPELLVEDSRSFPLLAAAFRLGTEHGIPIGPPSRSPDSAGRRQNNDRRAAWKNPMSPALRLVEAIAVAAPGRVQLGPRWEVLVG